MRRRRYKGIAGQIDAEIERLLKLKTTLTGEPRRGRESIRRARRRMIYARIAALRKMR